LPFLPQKGALAKRAPSMVLHSQRERTIKERGSCPFWGLATHTIEPLSGFPKRGARWFCIPKRNAPVRKRSYAKCFSIRGLDGLCFASPFPYGHHRGGESPDHQSDFVIYTTQS
jgi:hypothetical protein